MNNMSSQDSLFPSTHTEPPQPTSDYFHPGDHAPLAARMRPRSLDDVVGQEHLLGEGRPLRRLVEGSGEASVILYGPPGTGKTTIKPSATSSTESAPSSSSTKSTAFPKPSKTHCFLP